MVINIQESINTANSMDMENLNIKMEIVMREIFRMEEFKVKENFNILMEIFMKVNLKMGREKEEVFIK